MLDWHYAPTSRRGEVMTDMPFPLYPPGMYQVNIRVHEHRSQASPLLQSDACSVPVVASNCNDCSVRHVLGQHEHIDRS